MSSRQWFCRVMWRRPCGTPLLLLLLTRTGFNQPQHHPRVTCNHELLIRRDHPDGDRTVLSRNPRLLLATRVAVEREAEPHGCIADAAADLRRVLANSSRKHQCVDTSEHRRQRTNFFRRPIDEVLDREAIGRFPATEQVAHIVALA